MTAANDGSGRIFVVERGGRVRIVGKEGKVLPDPLIDLTNFNPLGSDVQTGFVEPVNAVSMSLAVAAVRKMSCSPMARAAFCKSAGCRVDSGLFGFARKATIVALGTSSCSSASRLGPSSALNQLTPVTLPPGRLMLATRPRSTSSLPGLYRYVRNPIYVAVAAVIFGQAVLFGDWRLFAYGSVVWLVFHLFVVGYEEPTLKESFGADYEAFRINVPRWIPRLTAWRGGR